MPTVQPSSPSRRAIAAPMPLAPPVSRMVLSFKPRMVAAPVYFDFPASIRVAS